MWITVDVERVLRVDRGINVILCNPMLGSGGPQTLVLKLKGSEMTDELQRLRGPDCACCEQQPRTKQVSAEQAHKDVRRERAAASERKRYESMSTAEKCAVQPDGFINDYD
jgi:hypothetical protein